MSGARIPTRILPALTALLLLAFLATGPFGRSTPVLGTHPTSTQTGYPSAIGTPNPFENPERAFTRQGNCNDPANCAGVLQGQTGEYRTFSLSIPPLPTLSGIEVSVGASLTSGDQPKVRLLDANEQPVGSQKSLSVTAGYSEQTVGSSTDLWGVTWDAASLNDGDFGVEISDASGTASGFLLDYVRVTVHYSNDDDHDGVANDLDNCRTIVNPDQTNTDQALAANGARIGLPDGSGVIPPLVGDADGDACDADDDNDKFTDAIENYLPTNPLDNCNGGPFYAPPGLDPLVAGDAWPTDFNSNSQIVGGGNVTASDSDFYQGSINRTVDTPLRKRLNIQNTDNLINLSDILAAFAIVKDGWRCQ